MPSDPWMKFYPSDWIGSVRLRSVSLEARGLWIDMLCIMHSGEPYGHLTVAGKPLDLKQLSRMVGVTFSRIKKLISELESAEILLKNSEGIFYSKRMVEDGRKKYKAKEYGKLGGNPGVKKGAKRVKGRVNPPPKPKDNPGDKPHIPEAILEEHSSSALLRARPEPQPSPNPKDQALGELFDALWQIYPNHADEIAAKRALFEMSGALPPATELLDMAQAWAESEQWREEDGRFVPKLSKWIRDGGWKNPPPKRKPKSGRARVRAQISDDQEVTLAEL